MGHASMIGLDMHSYNIISDSIFQTNSLGWDASCLEIYGGNMAVKNTLFIRNYMQQWNSAVIKCNKYGTVSLSNIAMINNTGATVQPFSCTMNIYNSNFSNNALSESSYNSVSTV